jgi:hypothetical protein
VGSQSITVSQFAVISKQNVHFSACFENYVMFTILSYREVAFKGSLGAIALPQGGSRRSGGSMVRLCKERFAVRSAVI